jgi:hypothetical protein
MKAVDLEKLKSRLSDYVRQARNAGVYPHLPPVLRQDTVTRLLDDERGESLSAARG